MKNWIKAVISVTIPLLIGGVSGFFTVSNVGGWYTKINRPTWNPPNWLFGPVWTVLYVMMGISMYLVWKLYTATTGKKKELWLYMVQLLFNFLWSRV